MKLSLFLKLCAGMCIAIIVIACVYYFSMQESILATYREATMQMLRRTIERNAYNIRSLPTNTDKPEELARTLLETTQLDCGLYTLDGVPIAHAPDSAVAYIEYPVIESFVKKYFAIDEIERSYEFAYDQNGVYCLFPVTHNDSLQSIAVFRLPGKGMASIHSVMNSSFIYAVLWAAIAGASICIILSNRSAHHIKSISNEIQRAADGDMSAHITAQLPYEFRAMAVAFNELIHTLATKEKELSDTSGTVYTLLSHLTEGVLILDKEGRIVMYNQSVTRVLQSELSMNKFYWECIRYPVITAPVEKILSEEISVEQQLEVGDYHVYFSGEFSPQIGHAVITFYDVTEFVRMSQMKRDLVSNVSHELRTPLTAIAGFVETLQEKADPEATKYLEIIQRNTKRLISIVSDLLTLSELDREEQVFSQDKVVLTNVLHEVLHSFERVAQEKGLALTTHVQDNIPVIYADSHAIQQVIFNLIDNACKYTEEGEISISLTADNENVHISITDTGIGMTPKEQKKVFDRFYVVDKSRSRQVGGTGLGLSIVKNIVRLHGGSVELTSTPGSGSTFAVSLPVHV